MPRLIRTKVENEGRTSEELAWVETPKTTPWDVEEELRVVGKPIARIDGVERVTGAAKFTTDIRLPRMLHACFLRSPHPHARILKIDPSAAEQMPGVRLVYTHKNVPSNRFMRERPLLGEIVRFVGDEVAAVAADSRELARAALKKIKVEYELLPFVLDAEAATAPDAPQVHAGGNLLDGKPDQYERGSVERGFAESDVVVERVFKTPVQVHNALETHSSVADWDGRLLTVWDSTQDVQGTRERVVKSLGLDQHQVRVIKQYVGGAFGAKFGDHKQAVVAAQMARQLKRPIRFVLDRREENIATGHRSATAQSLKVGAKKDGTLTALELTCYTNLGAFGSWGVYVAGPLRELYACDNVRATTYSVFTNTPPFSAFRAPGYVEAMFALESIMDELAARLEIDPLELRIKNYARVFPETGMPYSSNGLLDAYQEGARASDWTAKRRALGAGKRVAPENGAKGNESREEIKRGIGMASQMWFGAGAPPSYALVKINADATATVITATQDLGTGTKTVLAQIAAEELGFPLESIAVEIGDTQTGVYAGGSGGSMTIASVGPAVREAAADAREQLTQLAAVAIKKRVKNVRIENRIVRAPKVEKPLVDILRDLGDVQIIGHGSRDPNPGDYVIRSFGAQFVEVAVDMDTGEIRVERVVASHDAGRVMNPLTTSSQVEGGVLQAMGFALMENSVLDPATGAILNANLEGYHIPTIMDVPQIETHMIDRADNLINNLGVKGIGEPPIIPTAAAIANAVYHATGIRFYELPLTRERVLEALEDQEGGVYGGGRTGSQWNWSEH